MTTAREKGEVMAFDSLPEDMQVLLFEIADSAERGVPETFPINRKAICNFPVVPIGVCPADSRDHSYVQRMIGRSLPPIVVAHGRLIDGRHRLASYRLSGVKEVSYIDATEIVDADQLCGNLSMLDMGEVIQ